MIKAVIFDWSGVLCNDLENVWRADMAVFEHFGLPLLSLEQYRQASELPWREAYKKRGISDFEKITEIFLEKFNSLELCDPLPHAMETLEWMKAEGKKVAVLTAKTDYIFEKECKKFGFEKFIGLTEFHNDKRKAVKDVLEKLGVSRKEVLFVGDMRHDIETARIAGIKSVAVLSGCDTREKLEKEKPDYIIQGVGDLPALIEKLDEAVIAAEQRKRLVT